MNIMKTFRLLAICALVLAAGCGKDPKIDKVYNTVYINSAASSFQGSLTQGQAVAQGTKITLAYTNGLGKSAQVLLPEVNGLYCDPIDVRLASPTSSDNGNGTVEIPVSGTPTASGSMNLRPVIRVGEYEVFISIPATVTPAIALDAAASVVTGTFRIGQAIANGNIALHYTSYANQEVTVSADEVSGISSAEFTASLPAAPSGGTLDVPVTGTPSDYGTKTLKITMTQGDNTYTADIPVEIAGDIALDAAGSTVTGTLSKGVELSDVKIALHYTAAEEQQATISIDLTNSISCSAFDATLPAAEDGTVDVPLSGTPVSDGVTNLVVIVKIGSTNYTATIPVTVLSDVPGIPFEPETFTYQGLEYTTIFIDVNGNGYVDPGDVWLDRNIGAASADPGAYGADGINAASIGQMLQYGKPYGATAFDASYQIDYDAIGEWTVCPEGYAVPTLDQFNAALAKVTGGTISGNGVSGNAGITLTLMNSVMKLPIGGWLTNGDTQPQAYGEAAAYWTSSKGSNTAPWKVDINNSSASNTGANWADAAWQLPVRCIKK